MKVVSVCRFVSLALEAERWNELVFSLLSRALPLISTVVRRAVDSLASLGLLEISADLTGPEHVVRQRRLIEALLDLGWTEENAARAFAIIREAGQGLGQHFGGKVQLALRKYADFMLMELAATFAFTTLDEDATRDALTLWPQNVADLPISLRTQTRPLNCQYTRRALRPRCNSVTPGLKSEIRNSSDG